MIKFGILYNDNLDEDGIWFGGNVYEPRNANTIEVWSNGGMIFEGKFLLTSDGHIDWENQYVHSDISFTSNIISSKLQKIASLPMKSYLFDFIYDDVQYFVENNSTIHGKYITIWKENTWVFAVACVDEEEIYYLDNFDFLDRAPFSLTSNIKQAIKPIIKRYLKLMAFQ